MTLYYLNGDFRPIENDREISIHDRGFVLGDGVFTTLRSIGQEVQCLNAHINRLNNSLQTLHFKLHLSATEMSSICQRLLNNHSDSSISAIRITITRGISARGLLPLDSITPTILITKTPYQLCVPQNFIISAMRRHSSMELYRHKTLNYLDQIMARYTAIDSGADDALFLDEHDHLLSTTTANIFFWQYDHLITPPLTAAILPGVMRQQWIEFCRYKNLSVEERAVSLEDLKNTSAILISNSLIGVQSIACVRDHWQESQIDPDLKDLIAEFNK